MLSPGDAAPNFSATDEKGELHTLDQYRGKQLVIWFYPRADTPGCTTEGCGFRDLSAEFAKKNAAILGVSFDSAAQNRAFSKKHSFTFPLLCDTDRNLSMDYGACEHEDQGFARRIGVIIDGDGVIMAYKRNANANTYPAEALAALTDPEAG